MSEVYWNQNICNFHNCNEVATSFTSHKVSGDTFKKDDIAFSANWSGFSIYNSGEMVTKLPYQSKN